MIAETCAMMPSFAGVEKFFKSMPFKVPGGDPGSPLFRTNKLK